MKPARPLDRAAWLWAGCLGLALLVAYWPGLRTPFVFDDLPSLPQNPTLASLAHAWSPPPGGLTVSGRPLLNFTFALNRALGGDQVLGYHVANLAIHFAAALLLFGLVRRTLAARADADRLAGVVALLWALHPLQTESVTYTVQRAESLAGLFILAALYAAVRARASARPGSWQALSVAACFGGVATKETAVVAPLLVLLHDRTFTDGSFAAAIAARRRFYLSLLSSWLLLAVLVAGTHGRSGSASLAGPASPWQYAALQLSAIAHYARLAFWPRPLAFDYGPFQGVDPAALFPGAVFTVGAVGATAWLLWRRPQLGFLGASFFVLLAPSSSVVPIVTQVAAEHRVYLALAPLLVAVVLAGARWLPRPAAIGVAAVAALAGAGLTWQRNTVYATPLGLWRDAAAACPTNPRAHLNLGEQLSRAGRLREAIACFEAALRLQPDYVTALYNLGTALVSDGRPRAALAPLQRALELEPQHAEAAYNLGNAYAALGAHAEAVRAFTWSLRTQPDRVAAHYNLANSLLALDRLPEAIGHLRRAVALAPTYADARFNLANALLQSGQPVEAIAEYEAVLRLNPRDADAAANLRLARQAAAPIRPP